jgi:hypothetical protein
MVAWRRSPFGEKLEWASKYPQAQNHSRVGRPPDARRPIPRSVRVLQASSGRFKAIPAQRASDAFALSSCGAANGAGSGALASGEPQFLI